MPSGSMRKSWPPTECHSDSRKKASITIIIIIIIIIIVIMIIISSSSSSSTEIIVGEIIVKSPYRLGPSLESYGLGGRCEYPRGAGDAVPRQPGLEVVLAAHLGRTKRGVLHRGT